MFVVKKKEFEIHNEEVFEKYNQSQQPYATPKRTEKKSEFQDSSDSKDAQKEYYSSQVK